MQKKILTSLLLISSSHLFYSLIHINPLIVIVVILLIMFNYNQFLLKKKNIFLAEVNILSVLFIFGLFSGFISLFHAKVFLLAVVSILLAKNYTELLFKKKYFLILFKTTFILNGMAFLWFALNFFSINVPYLTLINFETKANLYLSIFGSTNAIQPLRPAGLFDEPGSLVFWNIMVYSIDNRLKILNVKQKLSNLMFLTSTGSFFLILVTPLLLINDFKAIIKKNKSFFIAIGIVFFLFIFQVFKERFSVSFFDNNRISQFYLMRNFFDLEILKYGWHHLYGDFKYGDISSFILNVPFIYGLFPTLFVIYLILKLILKINHRNIFFTIIFILLVIQRPYFFNIFWAIPLYITYYSIISKNEKNKASINA